MQKVNVKALRPFSHANILAAEGGVYAINEGDARELEKAGFVTFEGADGKPKETQVDQPGQVAQPGDVVVDNGEDLLGAEEKADAPLSNKSRTTAAKK